MARVEQSRRNKDVGDGDTDHQHIQRGELAGSRKDHRRHEKALAGGKSSGLRKYAESHRARHHTDYDRQRFSRAGGKTSRNAAAPRSPLRLSHQQHLYVFFL
ncbi:hypothetical protein SDC9_187382 [bioreactor metagenome]|uniref:Uncharacterized protein n=1 Tax=bioreactor metagenome TaxID=1076179 RepID=A0A645HLG0_9ZZZZ